MYGYVLGRVFSDVRYVLGALGVALTIVIATLLLPNKSVIFQVIQSDTLSLDAKMLFIFNILASIKTNFTFFSASYLFLVAFLFGINIALLTFYIRKRREVKNNKRAQFTSVGGYVSAVLGIGCAACGSIVLTAIFGLVGAGTIIAFLPLRGLEFGIVGVVLLLLSSHYLIRRINDPLVCSST